MKLKTPSRLWIKNLSKLYRNIYLHVIKGVPVEGFVKHFNEAQKQKVSEDSKKQFLEVISMAADYDLVILDEILPACAHGITDESAVVDFIKNRPEKPELVLTGRHPSEAMLSLADYVTEMQKCKHPYDCGVAAREGNVVPTRLHSNRLITTSIWLRMPLITCSRRLPA